MRMRWLLFLLVCIAGAASAQDCDALISADGMGDYYQKNRSSCRMFYKSLMAEVWVDKTGPYVYFNMMIKDTTSHIPLRKAFGNNMIVFHLPGNRQINYFYKDTSLNTTISIPVNKNPEANVKIEWQENDDISEIKDYNLFLKSIYENAISYISINKLNPSYPQHGARFEEAYTIDIPEQEATLLQQSLICIFKAIQ